MMTLHEAQAMLPGALLVGDGAVRFTRVHSDTRSLQAGDLFVALEGERFDAHDFLPQARAAGAVAALAEQRYPTRQELDAACPDRPVYLPRVGHAAVAKARSASGANPRMRRPWRAASVVRKCCASSGMSSRRSASAGSDSETTFRR